MKLLITGSSGYLGRSFMNAFSNKYEFMGFSLLQDSLDNLKISNIDAVLHCAALVHQKSVNDYRKYYKANVEYPVNLARKAKESGVKHFIFISTIAVYGEDGFLLKEDTKCAPVTPYGKSKLEAEMQLKTLEDESFIVSIVRPTMIYGKEAPGNIVPLIKLIKTIPIIPLGKTENKRSFVYIGNLIAMIDKIIYCRKPGIYLAADSLPISTSEFIRLISAGLQKKRFIIELPFFKKVLKYFRPSLYNKLYGNLVVDNTISKKILDFENPYTTEMGVLFMTEKL